MLSIMKRNLALGQFAGPGRWNDPDMLEVGNGGMTDEEYRTHFSMWAMMAAPLLIGTDLRKATPRTLEILGNREVIAIDQDPLGVQGRVVRAEGGRWVVAKPLKGGDMAVALFNESGHPQRIAATVTEVGLLGGAAYKVRDLWAGTDAHTAGALAATVPAHGTVLLRVSRDTHWNAYPPLVEVDLQAPAPYPGGPSLIEPGAAAELTTVVTNHGHLPARDVTVRLATPEGWQVAANRPATVKALPGASSSSRRGR